jgi:hypothetical protein
MSRKCRCTWLCSSRLRQQPALVLLRLRVTATNGTTTRLTWHHINLAMYKKLLSIDSGQPGCSSAATQCYSKCYLAACMMQRTVSYFASAELRYAAGCSNNEHCTERCQATASQTISFSGDQFLNRQLSTSHQAYRSRHLSSGWSRARWVGVHVWWLTFLDHFVTENPCRPC